MLSRGEQLLREITSLYFENEEAIYNLRPKWLLGLELDVYYSELSVAFEFQGEQHFGLCKFNDNSFEKLKKQVFYDKYKKSICEKENILLFQIGTFELTLRHFYKMLDKTFLPENIKKYHNSFLKRITKEKENEILDKRDLIKNEYMKYSNGRKIMSMKNPGARQGYLDNLLQMNPKTNRFRK